MDRNTITGFLLIFAMVIVYQLYFVPVPEAVDETQQTAAASPEATDEIVDLPATRSIEDSTYVPKTATLTSDVLEVKVSTDGGNILSAELRDGFLDYWNSEPIRLWTESGSDINWIARGEGSYDQYFDLTESTPESAVLTNRGNGPLRELTYRIDGYLLDVQARFKDAREKSDSNGRPMDATTRKG